MVAHQEPLVLGELVQDVPVVQMSQVQEVPIPRVHEAPMTQVLDGSGATLLQGVPAQVELSANDAPVGPINVGADGVDPSQVTMLGVCTVTWWRGAQIPVRPGTQPWATRSQPSSPRVPWAWGLLDCFCPVTPILHSRPSTVASGE
jgi:hypothetical protein